MTLKDRKFGSDIIIALIFLAVCIILMMKVLEIKTIESRIMPFFALGVISLSSILLIVKSLVAERPVVMRLLHSKREFIVWALFTIMIFMMRVLGFYPSILIFTILSQLYLKGEKEKQAILNSIIFAVILTLIIYIVFSLLLRMPLPIGSLFR